MFSCTITNSDIVFELLWTRPETDPYGITFWSIQPVRVLIKCAKYYQQFRFTVQIKHMSSSVIIRVRILTFVINGPFKRRNSTRRNLFLCTCTRHQWKWRHKFSQLKQRWDIPRFATVCKFCKMSWRQLWVDLSWKKLWNKTSWINREDSSM